MRKVVGVDSQKVGAFDLAALKAEEGPQGNSIVALFGFVANWHPLYGGTISSFRCPLSLFPLCAGRDLQQSGCSSKQEQLRRIIILVSSRDTTQLCKDSS